MKKLLSLFLCIPLFFISLLITHAEEIENNVEVILKNEAGNEISVTTLKTDISQEKLYRDTIGVILNERERLGEIYEGFSLQLDEEFDKDTEYTFIVKGLPDDEQMMLFHILDVDNKMTEQILFTQNEGEIIFKAKPNSLFFFIHVDEIEICEEEIMLLDEETTDEISKDFYYKGQVEEFVAPCSTTYKLEVWGASGGKDRQHEAAGGRIMNGGRGGYSYGEVILNKGDKLYIAAGGEGESFAFNNSGGGYNGGGDAGGDLSSGGGGGATHIARTNLGELSRYSNNRQDVLIVAGGGGGGGYFSTGGHGGGLTANADSSGRSKGGAAGFGSGQSRKTTDDGAGAGGGWAGGKVYVDKNDYGAGGGTGYLGNVQNGHSEIGVNSGNGRARITWKNVVNLTIHYLDKDTNEKVFDSYVESLNPDSNYSVKSPVLDNYLLWDENQSLLEGTLSKDLEINVFYKKLPEVKKMVLLSDEDISNQYIQKGQEVTYTIETENPLDKEIDIIIEDKIPEGIEVVSINQNGEKKDDKLVWNMKLPANSKIGVSFVGKTNKDNMSISNKATVKILGKEITSNTVDIYAPFVPVKNVKNLNGEDIDTELIKMDDTLVYSILLKNISSSPKEFHIEDPLLENLEYFEISDNGKIENNMLVFDLILNANEEKTLTFKAKINDDSITEITNKVKQTVDHSSVTSNTVTNYIAEEPYKEVLNKANENIDQDIIHKGEEIQYKITVTNPSTIKKIFRITDKLPQDFEVISTDELCTIENGVLTIQKEIEAKSSYELMITGKALKDSTYYENEAHIDVDHISFDTNMVEFWTSTEPVKKVLDEEGNDALNTLIYTGDNRKLTYTIEVHNPSALEKEFMIKDILNKAVVFESASDDGEYQNGIVTWKFNLLPEEKKTVSLTVKLNDEYAGEKITNKADVYVNRIMMNTNMVENNFEDKPDKIQVKGTILWDDKDDKDKIRPGAVTIRLYANGVEIRNQKVISSDDMKFLFDDVQKYQKGKEVKYTVKEDEPKDYTVDISEENLNEFKIVNKHVPGVKVNKITPASTPTPSVTPIFKVEGTKKVAPKTGDKSMTVPYITITSSIVLGLIAVLSLYKWR